MKSILIGLLVACFSLPVLAANPPGKAPPAPPDHAIDEDEPPTKGDDPRGEDGDKPGPGNNELESVAVRLQPIGAADRTGGEKAVPGDNEPDEH